MASLLFGAVGTAVLAVAMDKIFGGFIPIGYKQPSPSNLHKHTHNTLSGILLLASKDFLQWIQCVLVVIFAVLDEAVKNRRLPSLSNIRNKMKTPSPQSNSSSTSSSPNSNKTRVSFSTHSDGKTIKNKQFLYNVDSASNDRSHESLQEVSSHTPNHKRNKSFPADSTSPFHNNNNSNDQEKEDKSMPAKTLFNKRREDTPHHSSKTKTRRRSSSTSALGVEMVTEKGTSLEMAPFSATPQKTLSLDLKRNNSSFKKPSLLIKCTPDYANEENRDNGIPKLALPVSRETNHNAVSFSMDQGSNTSLTPMFCSLAGSSSWLQPGRSIYDNASPYSQTFTSTNGDDAPTTNGSSNKKSRPSLAMLPAAPARQSTPIVHATPTGPPLTSLSLQQPKFGN